jgi:hypothetical protein
MFFKINDTNYFVVPDGKNATQIFDEIYARMDLKYISYNDKTKILISIARQLREKKSRTEEKITL